MQKKKDWLLLCFCFRATKQDGRHRWESAHSSARMSCFRWRSQTRETLLTRSSCVIFPYWFENCCTKSYLIHNVFSQISVVPRGREWRYCASICCKKVTGEMMQPGTEASGENAASSQSSSHTHKLSWICSLGEMSREGLQAPYSSTILIFITSKLKNWFKLLT